MWPPKFHRSLRVKWDRLRVVNRGKSQNTLFKILVNSFGEQFWDELGWSVPLKNFKPEMSSSNREPLEYLMILVMKLMNSGSMNAWQFD